MRAKQIIIKIIFIKIGIWHGAVLKTKVQILNSNNTDILASYIPNDVVEQKELHPFNFGISIRRKAVQRMTNKSVTRR